jgi:hypothetical protein
MFLPEFLPMVLQELLPMVLPELLPMVFREPQKASQILRSVGQAMRRPAAPIVG